MANYPVLDGAGATIIENEKDPAYDVDTNYPVLDGAGAEIVARKYDFRLDFGPELIVNGGFDADSDWTKQTGWTVSGGKAVFTSGGTQYANIYQAFPTEVGKTYKLEYDLVAIDAATTSVVVKATSIAGATVAADNFLNAGNIGTGDITFVATATTTVVGVQANSATQNLQFDNMTVREVF